MKVYVASSWRNDFQPGVVERLRAAGHEVYDFRHPKPGDEGFSWGDIAAAWKDWTPGEYFEGLRHPIAQAGFKSDMDALRACDACVVVEPCGISAHLEFGWAVGAGKICIVYAPSMREPELMLAMADALCLTIADVLVKLNEIAIRRMPGESPDRAAGLGR